MALTLLLLTSVSHLLGVNGLSAYLRDKETGGLGQFLLVTPITPNEIIRGRAVGLWKQILPSALVCLGAYTFITPSGFLEEVDWNLGRILVTIGLRTS